MNNINWSKKVKNLDESIRKEIGIEEENEVRHILIKVQTHSAEPIEPAFIIAEDDIFLDLFVLTEGFGITSTSVIKDAIQSIGVIGGVTTDKIDPSKMPDETQILEEVGIYQ